MSLLAPLALLFGLLALPIILLYMLRLRRTATPVSSNLLWQRLLRDRQANAPWQRLRRNILLILQLLVLAALAFALARPFLFAPTIVNGSIVVLLDGSASMLANDVSPTRFDAARSEVHGWINDLSGDDLMTLILVRDTPRVLAPATADPAALRRALDSVQDPAPVAADWSAALALAAGAAQGMQNARIVIISDGGIHQPLSGDALPPLPGDILYVPIGQNAQNLAINALATRDSIEGLQLLAAVTNHGSAPQETLITIYVDDALFDARRITVAPGQPATFTWTLPDGAGATATIRAELSEQQADYLPHDDIAWAVNATGAVTRAHLLTEGNLFLEQLLNLLPGVNAARSERDAPPPAEPFDLTIVDSGPLPDPLPAGDLLLINPTTGNDWLTVGEIFSDTTTLRLADSPLLQFVEWRGVNIRRARQITAPWAQPIVEAEGGPLLLAGEQGGRRIAILTFDLRDSDLPLRVAFPVLIANITSWLNPGQVVAANGSLQPGQPAILSPDPGIDALLIQTPDGAQEILTTQEEQTLIFEQTGQLGIYTVTARQQGGDRLAGRFAVNLFAPRESAIAPTAVIDIGRREITPPDAGDVGRRELWPWLAALAFILLAVEWWVHHRGPNLPPLEPLRQRFKRQ